MSRKNNKPKRMRHYKENLAKDAVRLRKILAGQEKMENTVPEVRGDDIEEHEDDWVDEEDNDNAMKVENVPIKKKIHKKKDKLTQRRTIQLEKKRLRKLSKAPILKKRSTPGEMSQE